MTNKRTGSVQDDKGKARPGYICTMSNQISARENNHVKLQIHAVHAAILFLFLPILALAQPLSGEKVFTRADTLRGSITPERAWWDVTHYSLDLTPDFNQKSIEGRVGINFSVLAPGKRLQIDLQEPLQIRSAQWQGRDLAHKREGNVYYIDLPETLPRGSQQRIQIAWGGKPLQAIRPPWDGGWIFTRDSLGRPWMSVACQGLGASVWFPCKDHQSDEPDSMTMRITVPDTLVAVANGRLSNRVPAGEGKTTWQWTVASPINSYNIIPYIGKYTHWEENYSGERGSLDCSYWVLDYHEERARAQFRQVRPMLSCFEYWFGPYPFYADGFKLVEAPHLGMEHQSAVAYGNGFMNGYRGRDLSGSGWGLRWDFIIIHESGHEWFGNSVSTKDIADMWVHESFTNYSETLFTDCQDGKAAGSAYVRGTRKMISNDIPIIGPYGVNSEGSGDMYYKGGNMIHYIRQLFANDEKFRQTLRGMQDSFRHQTVTGAAVEAFWSRRCQVDLRPLFQQYLRTTQIPVLEYQRNGETLRYRWTNCISGYNVPVQVVAGDSTGIRLMPTTAWKKMKWEGRPDPVIHPDWFAEIRKSNSGTETR